MREPALMPILFITMCVQVFFLDNVDLGIFNKKHNVLPRISEFDQATIKMMITMATDLGKGPASYSKCMVATTLIN